MNSLVYSLKRRYREAITLIHKGAEGVDLGSGAVTQNEVRYELPLVAWVPTDVSPAWPTFPRNDSFAISQGFDLGVAKVLVDKTDLPLNYLISNTDCLLKGYPPVATEADPTPVDERILYYIIRVTDLQQYGAIELTISDTPKTEGLAR